MMLEARGGNLRCWKFVAWLKPRFRLSCDSEPRENRPARQAGLANLIPGVILPVMPAPPSIPLANQVLDNLFTVLAVYQKATGKSLSTCSREFYGKSSFFKNLKMGPPPKGQSLALHTVDVILDKIRADWPKGADWPMLPTIYMSRRPSDN